MNIINPKLGDCALNSQSNMLIFCKDTPLSWVCALIYSEDKRDEYIFYSKSNIGIGSNVFLGNIDITLLDILRPIDFEMRYEYGMVCAKG